MGFQDFHSLQIFYSSVVCIGNNKGGHGGPPLQIYRTGSDCVRADTGARPYNHSISFDNSVGADPRVRPADRWAL